MAIFLGESYSFGLLFFVNVFQIVCVLFPYSVLGWDVGFECINS